MKRLLFTFGLLAGSLVMLAVIPFLNNNSFSNTAMAQKNGYDNYVEYNLDPSYNTDKIHSDSPDEENKYECQKGPLEGFFVSSVEFCKRAPIIDGKGNVKDTQGGTGTTGDQTDSTEISGTKLYTVIGNNTFIQ
jgi:hypothetical protein